jgi:hypothetical protein
LPPALGNIAAGQLRVLAVTSPARFSQLPEEVQQRIRAEGGDPLTNTSNEYTADIDREMTKWGR